MIEKITLNTPLQTDFYQFTMSYAYLVSGKSNEVTGFESFYRHIKPEVAGNNNYYIFNGEKDVHKFMEDVKREFNDPTFFDRFFEIFRPKFKESEEEVDAFYRKAKKAFEEMNKSFEYTVVPNGTKVYPKVPVFQFKGSKMIGQMIETPITNIINGQTGATTFETFFHDRTEVIEKIKRMFNKNKLIPEDYIQALNKRAIEYRKATSKVLFEAGFRRAPNFNIAYMASKIAIDNGWNGTSNASLVGEIPIDLIGGTMAHAFIMVFDEEIDAFKAWNEIFPKSTILIDTYDSVKAVKKLIENNIRPVAVRIDSDPIEEIAVEVRNELDNAGWTEVKIFLSGDITPEKLEKWEQENIPFDMCMAGTKYVNLDEMIHVNAGFVYKIVEYEKDGVVHYPFKKAFGKSNYPGLKRVNVDSEGNITMTIGGDFGFNNVEKISSEAKVCFLSDIDFKGK